MRSRFAPLSRAARKLLRAPGFTAVAVLTLALGIGANAAIFSVVHGVLIQPLPFEDPERLVSVHHEAPALEMDDLPNSEATYLTYARLSRSLEAYGIYQADVVNLTGVERPERIDAGRLTASAFEALRVEPIRGPGLRASNEAPGADPVVVISETMWRQRMDGGEDVLERTLRLDGVEHRIVGVMPGDLQFPLPETRLWLPMTIDSAEPNDGNFNFRGVGRLAPGATVATTQDELTDLLPRMVEMFGTDISLEMLESTGLAPRVTSLRERVVGDVGDILWVLLGTVGLILLIACANVANLFLVRAEGRQREVAVRTALGAGRGDLAASFLGESVALASLGAVGGLVLAFAGVQALVAFGPDTIPRLHEVGITPPVLLFTLAVSLLAGLLFGAVPALRFAGGFSLVGALKEGGRGGTVGRDRHLARNALVVLQVALALVLLVGSGLMLRSFHSLRGVDLGFEPDGVLTLQVSLPEAEYPEAEEVGVTYQRMVDRVAALPGVAKAGAGSLPMTNQRSVSTHSFEGQPVPPGQVPPVVPNIRVVPGYFDVLGQRLVAGRLLERADHEEGRPVLLVNETLAETYWPGQDPLGRRLQMGMQDEQDDASTWEEEWYSVVGVVADTRFDGPAEEVPPMVFYANGPSVHDSVWFNRTLTLMVKAEAGVDPLSLTRSVRQAVWDLDPNLPVANVRTAGAVVDTAMARTSFTMVLLLIAAAVALVLGAIGLYGVISYIVSLRTQEIGVRMALGAPAGEVARRVVLQGLAVAGVGAAVGLAAAFALTRVMASLLFGVSPTDPVTFVGVSGTLLATAAVASWLPARRAASVDPLVALRHE